MGQHQVLDMDLELTRNRRSLDAYPMDKDAQRDIDEHGPVKLTFPKEEYCRQVLLRVLELRTFRQCPDLVFM